jgi:surfactin synthase thioesterase subunit
VIIYFLPFAGGSEISYNHIVNKLNIDSIKSIQCSLPGRGKRVEEELLDSVSAMADDIFRQIQSSLHGDSFAIFGHSMGALLAVHLLSLLKNSELPLPLYVFLSGRSGVIKASQPPLKHEMDLQDFNIALRNLGGIPNEIINDQGIMSFFRPIIRNDFKAIENYLPIIFFDPNLFVTVYFGDSEEFSANDAKSWQRITNQKIDIKCFHGGHFFIFDHVEEIVNDIYLKLRS